MLNIKKRVFIGSSKEAKEVAKIAKKQLECDDKFECVIWDKIFDLSETAYTTLMKKVITFDYAIFIASPDDIVFRKSIFGHKTKKTRDNIYLEIGLFTGALGKNRVYIMKHEKCTLATDLLGVTCVYYNDNILNDANQCIDCANKIKYKMIAENHLHRMSLRPSVCLAIGYFESFILPVVNIISNKQAKLCIDSKETYDICNMNKTINVIIPDVKNMDFKGWLNQFIEINSLNEQIIKYQIDENKFMTRRVLISTDYNEKNLIIYDVPTTLNTAFKTIDMLVNAGEHIGIDEDQMLVKKIEIADFYQTLQDLINNDCTVQCYVHIKKCNGYKLSDMSPYVEG